MSQLDDIKARAARPSRRRLIPVVTLKAHGWTKVDDGWAKSGAFFGQWNTGAIVGQFESEPTDYRVQIDIEPGLPEAVKLHLINAMADAVAVRDGAVAA